MQMIPYGIRCAMSSSLHAGSTLVPFVVNVVLRSSLSMAIEASGVQPGAEHLFTIASMSLLECAALSVPQIFALRPTSGAVEISTILRNPAPRLGKRNQILIDTEVVVNQRQG